jgi:small subunit ribosomal protein S15
MTRRTDLHPVVTADASDNDQANVMMWSPPTSSIEINLYELSKNREIVQDEQDITNCFYVTGMDSDELIPDSTISQQRIHELRRKSGRHPMDVGSPEYYQIVGMTEQIHSFTQRLIHYPHDSTARKALVTLVNQRRRLLNYLRRVDVSRYREVIQSLGIVDRNSRQIATKQHLTNKRGP